MRRVIYLLHHHQIKISFTLLALFNFSFVFSQIFPNFSASPLTVCVGEPISFTDLSTHTSGTITSWSWNFGDGNTSNSQNPSHTYSAPGTYNITLTVSDGSLSVAEVKPAYITINPLPNVGFETPSLSCTAPYAPNITNIQPQGAEFTYNWSFGNGQTSTSINPSDIIYNATGSYDIVLTVLNTSTGCQNSLTQTITVTNFSADFIVNQSSVCLGESFTFTDVSTTGANQWSWNMGNGVVLNGQNISYTYPSPGTYTVELTAQNTSVGCSDSHNLQVEVLALPQTSFTAQPTIGCAPLIVSFSNTSTPLSGEFEWNFGNGQTYVGTTPPDQEYGSNGNYSISLTQVDENGCTSTVVLEDLIEVTPLIPNFEADVVEGCEDLAVVFTDLSTSPNNVNTPITSWQWDFGNGSTFEGQSPPVQTFSEGKYTVTLTVITDTGCEETIVFEDYIQVGIPPIISFSYTPDIDCAKSEFEFTSSVDIAVPYDEGDVVWEWDFGDGGSSGEENPTYTYPIDTGYFDVQLIVSFRGCRDTVAVDSAVYVLAPIALFSPESTLFCNEQLPLSVEFTDEAILGTENDDVEMIWSWGDGTSDVLVSPAIFSNSDQGSMSHSYSNYGTYEIKQVVHNYTTGCSDSITRTISISALTPSFTLSQDSICRGFSISANSTSTSEHPITSSIFNMGNGSIIGLPNVTETYLTAGTYNISLQVTNSVGCQETFTINNFVVLREPQAQISPSAFSGCVPLDVTFNNTSTVDGNGVDLSSFEWTFEDGSTQVTTSTGESTNYTFNATGTFTTTLVATDVFGCVSTPTSVSTTLTSPIATFSVDDVVCNQETFLATNESEDFVSSTWFVNGEPVSSDQNLSWFFSEENPTNQTSIENTVQLVVTDANGCSDEMEIVMTVSLPQADANYSFTGSNINENGEFVCPPVFADLEDASSSYGEITTWTWTFGDNNGSSLENPSNTYVFAGTYTATLQVTDEYGCSDEVIYENYLVIGGPSGSVEWISVGDFCEPAYLFTPTETNNVANIIWTMGNGETVESVEPFTYSYGASGTYSPSAILQDANNCSVEYLMPSISEIITPIVADFSVNPSTVHVFDQMSVVDLSSGGSGGIVNWNWTFGNESFSANSGGGFIYEWQKPGQYTVTLVVTDSLGCQETTSVTVFVTADLYIPNVLTANGDGVNDLFVLREPVFTSYDIIIFNRWGNIVSERYGENDVYLWDGRNKGGEMCSEGVYFFKLIGTQYDGMEINEHGFVTLVLDK